MKSYVEVSNTGRGGRKFRGKSCPVPKALRLGKSIFSEKTMEARLPVFGDKCGRQTLCKKNGNRRCCIQQKNQPRGRSQSYILRSNVITRSCFLQEGFPRIWSIWGGSYRKWRRGTQPHNKKKTYEWCGAKNHHSSLGGGPLIFYSADCQEKSPGRLAILGEGDVVR